MNLIIKISIVLWYDVFRDGALSTVFVDGKACNKETFEDIRERLNGGNKDE